MFSLYLTPLAFLIFQSSATLFFPRQTESTCSEYGFVDCGANCLYANYTCCPDQASGCLTSASYCYITPSNEYDCCALGTICEGPDSAVTTSGTTTSTSYITVDVTSPSLLATDLISASTTDPSVVSTLTSVRTLSHYSISPTSGVLETTRTTSNVPVSSTTSLGAAWRCNRRMWALEWMITFVFLGGLTL